MQLNQQTMAKVDRHFVSINAEIETQPSKYHLQNSANKHKLTNLVTSNNKYPGRLSIKNNTNMKSLQNITKRTATISQSRDKKYYFLRKNNKSKSNYQQLFTQRKSKNLIIGSLRKYGEKSKSYRVHTIDYSQQDNKKDKKFPELKKNVHDNSLIDITNKKHQFIQRSKNALKRKNLIHEDLEDFTTALKSVRQKEQLTLNLKNRKYLKVKTEFEENECEKHYQNKDILIQNMKETQNKKVDFKKNKAKNLNFQPKKQTVDLNQIKKPIKEKMDLIEQNNQQENVSDEKYSTNNKNKVFNNYLDFINRRKKQGKMNSFNKKIPEERSLIAKSTFTVCTIPINGKKQSSIEKTYDSKSKQKKMQQTPGGKKQTHNIILTSRSKQDQIRKVQQNQFDCSSIAIAANQSSFLSDDGKKQIIISNFKEQEVKKYKLVENLLTELKQNSPKKKKRKRESKMSILCRSQLKQIFPDRFFI